MSDLGLIRTEIVYEDEEIRVIWSPGVSTFVLVTFADLTSVPEEHKFFGDVPIKKMGIAAIGVVAKRPNWYPPANLHAACQYIQDKIASYDMRVSYGGSMGGYAAIKYSKLLGITQVIALCPQWSIDPEECLPHKSDWYKYYVPNLNAMGIRHADVAGQVFIFADAFDEQDTFHRKKIVENCRSTFYINVPLVGHHVTGVLAGTDNLRELLSACRLGDVLAMRMVSRTRRRHSLWEKQILHFSMRRLPKLASNLLLAPDHRELLRRNWRSFPRILSHLVSGIGIERTVAFYEVFRTYLPGLSVDRIACAYLASIIGDRVSIQTAHGSLLVYDLESDKVVHKHGPFAPWEVPVDFELLGSSATLFVRVGYAKLILMSAKDSTLYLQPIEHEYTAFQSYKLTLGSDSKFSIGCNDQFFSAEPGGRVICNRDKPQAWEMFSFHPQCQSYGADKNDGALQ